MVRITVETFEAFRNNLSDFTEELQLDEQILHDLREILQESFVHTASMIPILFFAFLLVQLVTHRTKGSGIAKATRHPILGPIAAAALGLLPQCGFSVAATTLYLEGLIPLGSLLSAYISTSDEALPILLSDGSSLPWVLPLAATKFVWGIAVGMFVNAAILHNRRRKKAYKDVKNALSATHNRFQSHYTCSCSSLRKRTNFLELCSHALSRTVAVAAMVFVLSSLLNFAGHLAEHKITRVLSNCGFWQPMVASLVGLIPSCATSVAVAEGFRAGMLSFPATVSALTSNAGIGLLVLVKESDNKKNVLSVIVLLVLSAFLAGVLATILLPAGEQSMV